MIARTPGAGSGLPPLVTFGINSALAFATAELLTAALHETGHAVAAQLLGFSPRIYAFFEDNPHGTRAQDLAILAAGPLTSLFVGVLLLLLFVRGEKRYSFSHVLLLWLSWAGIMEFVNYLFVTPWLADGDTAQIADRLGWGLSARYAVMALGALFVFLLARTAAATMLATAPLGIPLETDGERRRFLFRGFYLPVVGGTLLTALGGIGGLPLIAFYGTLATLGNLDIVGAAMWMVRAPIAVRKRGVDARLRVEPIAIGLFILVVIWYIVALSRGIPI